MSCCKAFSSVPWPLRRSRKSALAFRCSCNCRCAFEARGLDRAPAHTRLPEYEGYQRNECYHRLGEISEQQGEQIIHVAVEQQSHGSPLVQVPQQPGIVVFADIGCFPQFAVGDYRNAALPRLSCIRWLDLALLAEELCHVLGVDEVEVSVEAEVGRSGAIVDIELGQVWRFVFTGWCGFFGVVTQRLVDMQGDEATGRRSCRSLHPTALRPLTIDARRIGRNQQLPYLAWRHVATFAQ